MGLNEIENFFKAKARAYRGEEISIEWEKSLHHNSHYKGLLCTLYEKTKKLNTKDKR